MDTQSILMNAFGQLDKRKREYNAQIERLEEEKESYMLSNKEFEDDYDLQIIEMEDAMNAMSLSNTSVLAERLLDAYTRNRDSIKAILGFRPGKGDVKEFEERIKNLFSMRSPEDEHYKFQSIGTASKQDYVYKAETFEECNNIIKSIIFDVTIFSPSEMDKSELQNKVLEIHKDMKKILPFYNRNIEFLEGAIKRMSNNKEKILGRSYSPFGNEIEKRRKEISTNLREINSKIEEYKKKITDIDETYKLYGEFKETRKEDKFVDMVSRLRKLGLITGREERKITYTKPEKVSEQIEIVSNENPSVEVKNTVNEIDNDYFRRPETECIICFLGEGKESFVGDINDIDKSRRYNALREVNKLIDVVCNDSNFKFDATGVPNLGPNGKVKRLVDTPFGFEYKRQGTERDKFRIHTIKRNSKVLKELGFGKGNIMFFGTVKPTDNKTNNNKTFNAVGDRCIQNLPSTLKPSFDYIEHITRGYVPTDLLSFSDKVKLKGGKFTMQNASIEYDKYISFDYVDDNTKKNVRNWLNEYFISQTNTLFEIKDMYTKKKGNTLD